MNPWGWLPERDLGVWRHGAAWLRPIAHAAPYVSVLLCLLLMYFVGHTLTASTGVLFDLPQSEIAESDPASLVALAIPVKNDTALFFDDVRYILDDGISAVALEEHISDRVSKSADKTLLVFADRRIPFGDLALFAGSARRSGVERVLFAVRREGDRQE